METTSKTNRRKRKSPAHADTHKPDVKDQKSRTLIRLDEDSTTGTAELQRKREEAAMKFVSLTSEFWTSLYVPGLRDLPDQERAAYVFGPHVHCTPQDGGTVFLKLGREWVGLMLETVTEAYRDFAGKKTTVEIDHKTTMEETLNLVRSVCKERGKVSWVLPRLDGEVAA